LCCRFIFSSVGQAASLLVRLYSQTNRIEHLRATRRAIQSLWLSNGSRAYFNRQYLWLEEYPLIEPAQGLFVLNGCLFALLGLLDAETIDPQPYVTQLIDELRLSLHFMLPLFVHPNRSNWSLYDLSHLTLGSNINIASFAYHLVHINLLQCLSQLFHRTHSSTSIFLDEYVQRFRSGIIDDHVHYTI
jgi:hypothetical protein